MLNIIFLLLLFLPLNVFADQVDYVTPEEYQLDLYSAKVIEIIDVNVSKEDDKVITVQTAKVKILNKDYKNKIFEVRNTLTGDKANDINLKKGLKISVHIEKDSSNQVKCYVINYERSNSIIILFAIFLICLLLIGGVKGFKAILALGITILLIVFLLIPLLLKGYSPILVSVFVCTISTFVTLIITAGFNKKAFSAIIGTIGGLIIGGLVAYLYGTVTKLTGFSSDDAQMLLYLPGNINLNFRGLLFAGIIIGALGASMDVSISISSSLTEIQKENPNISFKKLFQSGLNIGKDIMGTMINTLVLAYTGGTLSTILIFVGFKRSLIEIINLDSITTEIIRAIAGSIGLLFAIPITIFAYCLISKRFEKRNEDLNNEKNI